MIFIIKQYLKTHKKVDILELQYTFKLDRTSLSHILNKWIKSGKLVEISNDTSHCQTTKCNNCKTGCSKLNNKVYYQWIEEENVNCHNYQLDSIVT